MDFRNNPIAQSNRGLRNNNPLNLRPVTFTYKNQTGLDSAGHAIFLNMIDGVRAATLELYTLYFVHGFKTLSQLVHDIAPYNDGNNEASYVSFLKNYTNIGNGDIFLDATNIEKVLRAFFNVELGVKYANLITQSDLKNGINAANKKALLVAGAGGGGLLITLLIGVYLIAKK